MVVVSACEPVVLSVGRDVDFNSRVTVQASEAVRSSTQVPSLGDWVTVSEDRKGGQDTSQVSPHVKATCSSLEDLTEADMSVAWKVAVVGQGIETGAGASGVIWAWLLKLEAGFRSEVVWVDRGSDGSQKAREVSSQRAKCPVELSLFAASSALETGKSSC